MNGAPKGNRTLDLLLTMETLCRLSYRGNVGKLTKWLAQKPTNNQNSSVVRITKNFELAWTLSKPARGR